MTLAEDIETLSNDLETKKKLFDEQSELCESELAAGRTGLTAFLKADEIFKDMERMAGILKEKIAEALRLLGA
jgi:hypothetical protein